jgi:hypothetical protein
MKHQYARNHTDEASVVARSRISLRSKSPKNCSWKAHFLTNGNAFEKEDPDIEDDADTALCGRAFFTICRNETNTTDKDVANADETG